MENLMRNANFEYPFTSSSNLERRKIRWDIDEGRPKSASSSVLDTKISTMRNQLQLLKKKVEMERKLLEQDRMNMQFANVRMDKDLATSALSPQKYRCQPLTTLPSHTSPKFEASTEQFPDTADLSSPSKRQLKDIERECDVELTKLQNYIRNISELKIHWKTLMEENRLYELGQFQSLDTVNKNIKVFSDEQFGSKSDGYFQ